MFFYFLDFVIIRQERSDIMIPIRIQQIDVNNYKRIIELVEFTANKDENTFICKFKINENLGCNSDIIYEFTHNTVPSQFSL